MKLVKHKRSGTVYEVRNIETYSVTFTLPNNPQEIYDSTERFKTDYEPYEVEEEEQEKMKFEVLILWITRAFTGLTVLLVIAAPLVIYNDYKIAQACAAKGGELVRTQYKQICVKLEVVK